MRIASNTYKLDEPPSCSSSPKAIADTISPYCEASTTVRYDR